MRKAPGLGQIGQHDAGDGRPHHAPDVEHHGAHPERARHQRPLLDDDTDQGLPDRHFEGVGRADQGGNRQVGRDRLHTGRRHGHEKGRERRQNNVDDDQGLEPRQAIGGEPCQGTQEQVENIEQEAGEAKQDRRVGEAEHQPGDSDLLDPATDDRDRVTRDVQPEARLAQRRWQPQLPVRQPAAPPLPSPDLPFGEPKGFGRGATRPRRAWQRPKMVGATGIEPVTPPV